MNDLIIRKIKNADINKVSLMVKELIGEHNRLDPFYRRPEEMKDLLSDLKKWPRARMGVVLVAEVGGKLVGYARGSIGQNHYFARDSEKIVCVDDLFVKKQYRRQQIGKNLLQELFQWFKKGQATVVMLYVDVRNDSAIKFWKKMGFDKFTLRMKRNLL